MSFNPMRHQWRFIAVALALMVWGTVPTVVGQIPKLVEVPSTLPEVKLAEMRRTRAVLIERRDQLQAKAKAFNAKCANVTVGTPLAAECEHEQKLLDDERTRYIRMAKDFNANLTVQIQLTQLAGKIPEFKGDVRIVTPDGRSISGSSLGTHTLTSGSRIATGPDGHITVRLMDDTKFSLGPNSELVVDDFVYDPDHSFKKTLATFSRGTFRFISGKVAAKSDVRISLPTGDLGNRGTEYEATVRADGSGEVRMFTGQIEVTKKRDGAKFLLGADQKVSFDANGVFSSPRPVK